MTRRVARPSISSLGESNRPRRFPAPTIEHLLPRLRPGMTAASAIWEASGLSRNEPTNLQPYARSRGPSRLGARAGDLSPSLSEYSDYYEHRHAGARTIAAIRDAAPTTLEWVIGS